MERREVRLQVLLEQICETVDDGIRLLIIVDATSGVHDALEIEAQSVEGPSSSAKIDSAIDTAMALRKHSGQCAVGRLLSAAREITPTQRFRT